MNSQVRRARNAFLASLLLLAGALPASAAGQPRQTMDKLHPQLIKALEQDPNQLVDIIVSMAPGSERAEIAAQLTATLDQDLPLIRAKHLRLPAAALRHLQNNPAIQWASPDAPVKLQAIDVSLLKTTFNQTTGAPYAWNTLGLTGRGVGVAVLDSGLVSSIEIHATPVRLDTALDPRDQYGHGTHVAGIISGTSQLGYMGVAPGARVYSIRVSDSQGQGTTSELIRGLQWVSENARRFNIRVVNLSIQSGVAESYRTSPVAAAAEQLWKQGIVVVAASGNQGDDPRAEYYPPGNDPYVITVGAVDDNQNLDPADDTLATFSGRGTTQDGYYRPDLVAPGRRIVSNLAPFSTFATTFPDRIVNSRFIAMSGTSFSAPVVSGAVALLLQKYPSLTPDQVKWLLVSSGRRYAAQPDSAPQLDIRALFALAGKGIPGVRQSFPINQFLTGTSSTGATADQIYWDQIYWDQIYWDQIYWDQSALPL